jgi:hypothetical protein
VIAARMWALLLAACGVSASLPPSAPDPPPRAAETCELPRGVTLRELAPGERGLVLRRLFACNDLRHGRISQADYVRAIAAIDAEWASLKPPEVPPPKQPIAWASTVRGFSSQYGDPSWAATQVLGPPNVFPKHGDIPQAWASHGPDDGAEWIEVGFARPSAIAAVVIYETYNPGAVARVTLTMENGATIAAPMDQEVAETSPEGSVHRRFELACTQGRVQAVRLELDSVRVPGWNEIDAIGVVPCKP